MGDCTRSEFVLALERLINRYSEENGSDTPDYILADYLSGCLRAFNIATKIRDKWHGFNPNINEVEPDKPKGDE